MPHDLRSNILVVFLRFLRNLDEFFSSDMSKGIWSLFNSPTEFERRIIIFNILLFLFKNSWAVVFLRTTSFLFSFLLQAQNPQFAFKFLQFVKILKIIVKVFNFESRLSWLSLQILFHFLVLLRTQTAIVNFLVVGPLQIKPLIFLFLH